ERRRPVGVRGLPVHPQRQGGPVRLRAGFRPVSADRIAGPLQRRDAWRLLRPVRQSRLGGGVGRLAADPRRDRAVRRRPGRRRGTENRLGRRLPRPGAPIGRR
ncbi:hypothetical protein LTR94_036475, partial [Friedmanniomyces endolithicus]